MSTATIHETKTHLSRFLREVRLGNDLIITQGQTPVARIVSISGGHVARPKLGTPSSEPVQLSPNAFAPLDADELKEWGL